jgi:diguanylate cyclase (GGDEF)-like protein
MDLDLRTVAVPMTVSIGIADRQPGREALIDLMRAADEAMYAAKTSGRNRVSLAAPARG